MKTMGDSDRWCLCSGDNMIYTSQSSFLTKLIWITSPEVRTGEGCGLGAKGPQANVCVE